MMKAYIPTVSDVDFEEEIRRKAGKYQRTLYEAFTTHMFGSNGEKKNCFVLVSVDEEVGSGLRAGKSSITC